MAGTCKLKGSIKELLRILELNFSFPESQITDPSVNASIQQRTVLYKKSPAMWWGADNMRVTVQGQCIFRPTETFSSAISVTNLP